LNNIDCYAIDKNGLDCYYYFWNIREFLEGGIKMEILSKRLGEGEVRWKGVVIPRAKKDLFPERGVEFNLLEGKTIYKAKMDNQFRIRLATWFRRHPTTKAGDQIAFFKENGKIRIALSKNFSKPDRGALDWAKEVLEAIGDGEVHGTVRTSKNGFTVEIGEHIKETQIILGTT
jgi:hypothetical protein